MIYQAVAGLGNNHYQDLATALVRHMVDSLDDPSDEAHAAGRAWGEGLREQAREGAATPLEGLVAGMTRTGLQPEFEAEPAPQLAVVPCPFMDLSEDRPEVVCQLHLGLAEDYWAPIPAGKSPTSCPSSPRAAACSNCTNSSPGRTPMRELLSIEQYAAELAELVELGSQTQRLPLNAARGGTLAEAALAPVAVPAFTNSAMDGYAVRSPKRVTPEANCE